MHAYTHTTVIDGTGAPAAPEQTVLVDGDRIITVGPTAEVPVPESAEVTDLSGTYAVPGLAEMHGHSDSHDLRSAAELFLVNGVTTVREMWGNHFVREERERIERGTAIGPRWTISSNLVDGVPSLYGDTHGPWQPTAVADEADAHRAVRQAHEDGADFIKVYSRVEREPYLALLAEAERTDITVAGHRSDLVPLAEQIERGQRSFEHVHGLWPALAKNAAEAEAALASISIDTGVAPTYYGNWFRQITEVEADALKAYDTHAAAAVFGRMVANDVAYCPTLVLHEHVDLPERIDFDDPLLRYLPPYTRDMWAFVQRDIYGGGRTAAEDELRRTVFERRRELVVAMDAAGVRLLTGTDCFTPGILPGFSIHDELELLVGSGLSPNRVLQIASLEAARFLGREQWSGTIESGKVADFVILNADPLADIRNTRHIHTVVSRGNRIGPEERAALLTGIEQRAAAVQPPGE